jgi:hypothetical protein
MRNDMTKVEVCREVKKTLQNKWNFKIVFFEGEQKIIET